MVKWVLGSVVIVFSVGKKVGISVVRGFGVRIMEFGFWYC